ncbi:MAG: hypothetical protein AAFZ35_16950 [Cyanobacteria bacterium J06649_12]
MSNKFGNIHTEETDAHGIKTVLHVEFGKPESSYLKFFDGDKELDNGTHHINGKKVVISVPSCHGEIRHEQLREMMAVKHSRHLHIEGESMLVAMAPVKQ